MSKRKKLKMIKVEKNEIRVIEIEDKLENLQKEVGGYIECVDIFDHLTLICNEEGKILQLPINLILSDRGKYIDAIAGDFLICGDDHKGNFISLTDNEIETFLNNKKFTYLRLLDVNNED